MKLPELPRKRLTREADITPEVLKWFMDNYPKSVAVEVKIKGGRLKPHQPVALKQVSDGVFGYKLPDMGRRNPFDLIIMKDTDAVVAVCDGRNCTAYTYEMKELFTFRV